MDNGAYSYQRYLNGDDSGMAELVRDYRDGLLLYLNSYLHNLSLAEDCVQDTFIRLAVKKPAFRGQSTFKTWLYTVGRNIAVSCMRKAARRGDVLLDESDTLRAETDLERAYLKEEQKITVRRALRRLNPDYQRVLYLSYFEDFCNADTAKIMGKSKRQIENLLYHAKKALRSELEKEGFDYEEL